MRLTPAAPFLPLEALRATTVADVFLPQGGMVWYVLRHDSVAEAHVPNAARFEPQRWLEGGAASAGKGIGVPLGAGVRTCPGRYLPLPEITVAMAPAAKRCRTTSYDRGLLHVGMLTSSCCVVYTT